KRRRRPTGGDRCRMSVRPASPEVTVDNETQMASPLWAALTAARTEETIEQAIHPGPVEGHPSVHHQGLAGDETGQIRTQEDHHVGDVLGVADATDRRRPLVPFDLVEEAVEQRL